MVVSNQITLTAVSRPVAKYILSDSLVCVNEAVQLTDKSKSTESLSYEWSFGDGETSAEKNPSHIYKLSGVYSTSLIITTSTDCKDTAALSTEIKVIDKPTADFSISPTDTSIFYPTITFTDKSS